MKKILHLALNGGGRQLGLVRALSSLGEYLEIDWQVEQAARGVKGMREYVNQTAKDFGADLTFMQLQTPNVLNPAEVMQFPGFVVNWTGDVRQPTPRWYFEMAPSVNVTLFTNMYDVEQLRKAGLIADYLQIGYDEEIYTSEGSKGTWPEIVFLGNNYKNTFPLSGERIQMVEQLRQEFGSRFQVYGNGWGTRWLTPEEEAECYRSCKIAINQNHFNLPRFSSDRILRITGCGAMCISNRYEGYELEYPFIRTWDDFTQLIWLIHKYLDDSKKRDKLATSQQEDTALNNTWMARMVYLQRLAK